MDCNKERESEAFNTESDVRLVIQRVRVRL